MGKIIEKEVYAALLTFQRERYILSKDEMFTEFLLYCKEFIQGEISLADFRENSVMILNYFRRKHKSAPEKLIRIILSGEVYLLEFELHIQKSELNKLRRKRDILRYPSLENLENGILSRELL